MRTIIVESKRKRIDVRKHDLFFYGWSADVFGLKGVRIWNPEAIRAGESLRLSCDYDLDGVPLYSIKWYFGDQEFYRFVPKESPPTRVFPLSGDTSVDVSIHTHK